MSVDLSTLKVGDSLKLRCGGVIEIEKIIPHMMGKTINDQFFYNTLGRVNPAKQHPLDVMEIIRKPGPTQVTFWVNLYENGTWDNFDSIECANKYDVTRVACKKITITEGEWE